jgi:hypothetical protein
MTFTIDIRPVVANLEAREWVQRAEVTDSGAVCAHGAVMTCKGLAPGDEHIIRAVMRSQGLTESWNDAVGRTKAEVFDKLAHIEVTDAALAETFGPQWEAIVALIRRAAVLTPGEAERLSSVTAWDTAGDTAGGAAWDAAWGAACSAAWDAARDAFLSEANAHLEDMLTEHLDRVDPRGDEHA